MMFLWHYKRKAKSLREKMRCVGFFDVSCRVFFLLLKNKEESVNGTFFLLN